MKIQCACGTKYAFEVTPEMARSPVRFICQNCGQDNSDAINQLIRQQFPADAAATAARPAVAPPVAIAPPPSHLRSAAAATIPPGAPPPVPASTAPAVPAAPPMGVPLPPPRTATPSVRVAVPSAAATPAGSSITKVCSKHPGQFAAQTCLVCQKPICPKCMELFGYVCSAYCKGKAESQGMELPVYAGQRDLAQSRQWRKTYAIVAGIAAVLFIMCGVWFWYAWVGSMPKVVYSAKLTDPGLAGQLAQQSPGQLVLLHAGTLARYDTKASQQVWAQLLIDKPRIAEQARIAFEKNKAAYQTALANGEDVGNFGPPDLDDTRVHLELQAAGELHLYQHGENIWVAFPGKVVRFDWQTGKAGQELPLDLSHGPRLLAGADLWCLADSSAGPRKLTRLNLASGEAKTEELGGSALPEVALAGKAAPGGRTSTNAASRTTRSAPLDPKAVAANYDKLSTAQKMALPAVAAANANQQRLSAEMRDTPDEPAGLAKLGSATEPWVLTPSGPLRVSTRLLEAKVVARKVMKDPPKKSALEGTVNAAATTAIANEILNEIQRDRGGDTEEEDVSRYQITLNRPTAKGVEDWKGEVSGTPEVFPLETVDVIAAGKSLLVFDRNNRKRWEAKLNYPMRPASHERFGFASSEQPNGQGPCVERGDTLHVFDDGVLTCFELATGNVRWRLPSVGTTGLFFDEHDRLYVNTTTATPDNVKYSRQIDVSEKLQLLVLQVEARTGKTTWGAVGEGHVCYVSGKFLYTMEAHPGQGSANDLFADLTSMFDIPPHIRVRRLDTGSGRVLWQHYQKRAPLDVLFDRNSFHVLFKQEVQLIRFLSL